MTSSLFEIYGGTNMTNVPFEGISISLLWFIYGCAEITTTCILCKITIHEVSFYNYF